MTELKLAFEVPRWAWDWYTAHLGLVLGLSLVASVQRLVVVNWTGEIPSGLATASEVVVLAVRVALVVLMWRSAMAGVALSWGAARAFVSAHWPSLLWQVVFLGAAFAVFEVLAEHVVSGLLPESARQAYLAVLLFVKNPTVIALTVLWWIGVVRQVFGVPVGQPVAA
ncbi:hypothetical protein [Lentzea sp.]|uniref:hypothetical protein n=1 Tax=Lentzea sp. TaxID=56099 RepID=UPI002ED00158